MPRDWRSPFVPLAGAETSLLILTSGQTFTGDHLLTLIKKLVEVDKAWIPTDPGTSLCKAQPSCSYRFMLIYFWI